MIVKKETVRPFLVGCFITMGVVVVSYYAGMMDTIPVCKELAESILKK